jgi:hypothetical protein
MSVMAENGNTVGAGGDGAAAPAAAAGPETGGDGEDVVRLGDEHVSGVESLCVGESQ